MSARRIVSLGIALLFLAPLLRGRSAEPDPQVTYDEATLRSKGIATDGPGLLAYFKARTLSAADLDRLAATVRNLGDNDFETREKASHDLIAAGRPAFQFLKSALNDSDLEIARRARQAMEEIEANRTSDVMSAAARILAERRPPGAAAVLLAYLPCNDEEVVEESLFTALRMTGLRDGKPDPAVTAALTDKLPLRRAAAAHVQGRAPAVNDRRPVARLLADTDSRVRFEAAAALTRAGEKAAVPVLIAQLTDGPTPLAWQAEDMLSRLAGEDAAPISLGATADERRLARTAWEKWWAAKGDKVDLTKLQNEEPLLGLTLVSEYDGHTMGGRVYELGKDGKERWSVTTLNGPNDAQALPGGRMLVAERNANRVTERDRKGTVLWEQKDQQSPIACQRLPGGNTLIASFGELYEVIAGPQQGSHLGREATAMRFGCATATSCSSPATATSRNWTRPGSKSARCSPSNTPAGPVTGPASNCCRMGACSWRSAVRAGSSKSTGKAISSGKSRSRTVSSPRGYRTATRSSRASRTVSSSKWIAPRKRSTRRHCKDGLSRCGGTRTRPKRERGVNPFHVLAFLVA